MIFSILVLPIVYGIWAQNDAREEQFKLTIIHTNDVHAHFVESDKRLVKITTFSLN